jgi:hypothetical protein
MWISLAINVFLKVPITLALIFASKSEALPAGNPNALMQGMVYCMSIGLVITLVYYRIGRWKNKSVVKVPVKV